MDTLTLVHIKTEGRLPTSTFELADQGEKVGFCQIRHRPSHGVGVPPEAANHVYYEIVAPKRGMGYGKHILKLAIGEASKLGMRELIICASENNHPSRRIIESNGGEFTGAFPCADGHRILRYVIRVDGV
jgi:predicted acetyltransferase